MPSYLKMQACLLLLFFFNIAVTNQLYAAFPVKKDCSVLHQKVDSKARFNDWGLKIEDFSLLPQYYQHKRQSGTEYYFGFASFAGGVASLFVPPHAKTMPKYYSGSSDYSINSQVFFVGLLCGVAAIAFSIATLVSGEHRISRVLATIGGVLGFVGIVESLNIYNGRVH